MKVTCPKCKTGLVLPDDQLKSVGMKIKCSGCGVTLTYKGKVRKPAGESPSDSGLPPSRPSASVPGTESAQVLPEQERQPLPESSLPPAEAQAKKILPEDRAALESLGQEIVKEQEAPKETEAAPPIFQKYSPPVAETGSRVSRRTVLIAALAVLFVIVLAAVYFFSSQDTEGPKQVSSSGPAQPAKGQPAVQSPLSSGGAPLAPPADSSPGASSPAVPSGMTEEKAIEIVKKSDALMKMTTVETIVDKWTTENAGKYTMIGWQAKKMDEQNYLVTYTARSGEKATGFYFALDLQTGAVQDIAHNKELQTKYNIKYDN